MTKSGLRPDLSGTVHDRWWPDRVGVVVKRLRTRLHVRWLDGEVWSYDGAHARFLKLYRMGAMPGCADTRIQKAANVRPSRQGTGLPRLGARTLARSNRRHAICSTGEA